MSKSALEIRPVRPSDRDEWARMRRALWPDSTAEEVDRFFRDGGFDAFSRYSAFVADCGQGRLGGFIEMSARGYAEGCSTSPVGFIEGWYVDDDLRRSGVGGALIGAAENWARAQGFTEMGSDALIENDISIAAHKALGFEVVERLVTFAKKL